MVRDNRWLIYGLLFLDAIAPVVSQGNEPQTLAIPPNIERVLRWFPEDTETLVVAQKFAIAAESEQETTAGQPERADLDINGMIQELAMDPVLYIDNQKHRAALAGKRVTLALRGSRNHEVISSSGSLRDEGCAVMIFEEKIDAIWLDRIRVASKKKRKIGLRDVLEFPSTTVMGGGVKLNPWQGTFVTVLEPNVLLCTTSVRYLAEILNRIDTKPTTRALADDLPEWKQLDLEDPNWLLRHMSKQKRKVVGLTLTVKQQGFQVVYIPTENSGAFIRERAERQWTATPSTPAADIRIADDGNVIVTSSVNDFFIMNIYSLQGGGLWRGELRRED